MKRRNTSAALAAALIVASVALSLVVARADGYGFSPPSGWRAQRAPLGYSGLWVNPAGQEAVNLATVATVDLSTLVSRQMQRARALYPSLHVYDNVAYSLCDHHTGRYLIWTALSHGYPWVHEQVMATWGSSGYVASYVRPENYRPNRGARAALVSICAVAGSDINNPSSGGVAPPSSNGSQPAPEPESPSQPNPYGQPTPNPVPTPRYMPVIPM